MRAMVLISGTKCGDLRLEGRDKGTHTVFTFGDVICGPTTVGPTNPRVCLVEVTGNFCRTSGNKLCDIPFAM
jgi:hypothetical protein